VEELARLAQGGAGELIARRLDVTDDATIAQVVGEIHDRCGAVDVLVNNAGYGQIGAVEEVSCALWRQQMEVNFIGAVAVTRACLPQMRARGRGRIINVSSVVAHVPLPLMGAYCASKHALEAFSVALRLEMAPFHVDVVLIEPGPISTQFRTHAAKVLEREGIGAAAPYAEMHRTLNAHWQSRFGRQDTSAEVVAACIARAVRAARPKRRYRITAVARWLPRLLAIMPESVFDAAMRRRMRRLAAHAQEAD
jgi:NAD(P)-dependent dehydrogenase (short-subunit alcohol dehydrogenase family)